MNEIITTPLDGSPIAAPALRREREIRPVVDVIPILDTARFEHMQRVAVAIAKSSMIPESLCKWKNDGQEMPCSFDMIVSNCFLVVNQAVRWGMDPFSVISCCSMVKGRLTFEGKLIAAVLEAKLGVELDPVWNDKTGDEYGITITGKLPSGKVRSISGTVGEWKTTGSGTPWGTRAGCTRQLLYRGTREWARFWAAGIMLGVYSDDEMADLQDAARANRALPVPSQQEQMRQIQSSPATTSGGPRVDHQAASTTKNNDMPAKTEAAPTPARKGPPSPPKGPPSAPVAGAVKPAEPVPAAETKPEVAITDGPNWPQELEGYANAVAACEAHESLAETVETYGAMFDDAPADVVAKARTIEADKRTELGPENLAEETPAQALMADLRASVLDGHKALVLVNALDAAQRALVTEADKAGLLRLQKDIEARKAKEGGRGT